MMRDILCESKILASFCYSFLGVVVIFLLASCSAPPKAADYIGVPSLNSRDFVLWTQRKPF